MVWIVGTYATNPGVAIYKAKKGQTPDMDNNMYIYVRIAYPDSTVYEILKWYVSNDVPK